MPYPQPYAQTSGSGSSREYSTRHIRTRRSSWEAGDDMLISNARNLVFHDTPTLRHVAGTASVRVDSDHSASILTPDSHDVPETTEAQEARDIHDAYTAAEAAVMRALDRMQRVERGHEHAHAADQVNDADEVEEEPHVSERDPEAHSQHTPPRDPDLAHPGYSLSGLVQMSLGFAPRDPRTPDQRVVPGWELPPRDPRFVHPELNYVGRLKARVREVREFLNGPISEGW